ncbi:competence/damage-inducible protein A [Murdochiella massiliensis]|uniref:competence/damage-inducible protein A n=1 Tax=Murdochiella massiliensis TaxID=1673723 RepID=UPI000829E1FA|nr:competence/damage-inducible protein A [Murdochiella massiliensis]
MIVECISVGTEILLGDILNTNVQYLSQLCAEVGLDVFHTSVVGDNEKRLTESLCVACERADVVILTGGLGSTDDDITKRVVINFLHQGTQVSEYNKKTIEGWFDNEKARKDNEIVYTFPKNATILENQVGTASGAVIPFDIEGKKGYIVILPGPPKEMIPMVEKELRPVLYRWSKGVTESLVVRFGILGEYQINERLREEISSGTNPTIAPYVKEDGALIRITAKASTDKEAKEMIAQAYNKVKEKLGKYIVAVGEETRSDVLVRLLRERNESVSMAESITGGMVASTVIESPGASIVLEQAFVVYSDRAKHKLLGIPKKTLEKHTAVSRKVCRSMLKGLAERTGSDLCIATTGYAGPEGEEVGLCYIGIGYHGKRCIFKHHLHGERNHIRNRAKNLAIDYAIMMMKGELWEE